MGQQRSSQPTPHWRPVAQMPLIATAIDGMLEGADEQYQTLQPARSRPYVLDDATVGRLIKVFTEQRDMLWVFEEQLHRWEAEDLTDAQRREVRRLRGQLERLRQVIAAILELADEFE